MDANGGGAKRVTYKGEYNQTPAWCPDPKQQLIAFTGRADLEVTGASSIVNPILSPRSHALTPTVSDRTLRFSAPAGLLRRALLVGLVAARLAFVVQFHDAYLKAPLSMLDIRDGGWSPAAGGLASRRATPWPSPPDVPVMTAS